MPKYLDPFIWTKSKTTAVFPRETVPYIPRALETFGEKLEKIRFLFWRFPEVFHFLKFWIFLLKITSYNFQWRGQFWRWEGILIQILKFYLTQKIVTPRFSPKYEIWAWAILTISDAWWRIPLMSVQWPVKQLSI